MKAKLPILLYAIDYRQKCITCTREIVPSGDVDHDMALIKDYYKDFTGRHPERFAVSE